MIDLIKFNKESKTVPSTLVDPFKIDGVKQIVITIAPPLFETSIQFEARVRFKKGDTVGYHTIKTKESFQALMNQLDSFLESLN